MRCLVADKMHESLVPMLEKIGVKADYEPGINRGEIIRRLGDYEGLIIRSKTPVDAELLQNADGLVFVARAGAGVDNLDEEELKRRNIAVLNAPEGNRNAVGEHTLGLLLALLHNLMKGDREVRQRIWDREGNRGWELAGRTVGIIGYGFMGMQFAKKLKSMECRVLAYDKYKRGYSDEYCEETTLGEIFENADILSLHIPLTSETKGYVDRHFLGKFRKPILLLNTARGEIVVLRDLIAALKDGSIQAAALDVLENEKLATFTPRQEEDFRELCRQPNVLLTPHVAGWTFESYVRINEILSRKIELLLKEKGH